MDDNRRESSRIIPGESLVGTPLRYPNHPHISKHCFWGAPIFSGFLIKQGHAKKGGLVYAKVPEDLL